MPIRLNLLAEAQAAEEMRRRDPVKRAIWGGAILVAVMLAWSSWVALQAMLVKSELSRIDGKMSTGNTEFQDVLENQKQFVEIKRKLTALRSLSTNRFLNGNLLQALQEAGTDDVRLTRLKTSIQHVVNEGTKPKTNAGRIIPGKPATVTDRLVITLEARDTSANPGDQVNRYKSAIGDHAYFQNLMGKTNEVRLANLSPPQQGQSGEVFVQFTLECRPPERTR